MINEIMNELVELRFKVIGAKDSNTGKIPDYRNYAVTYFLNMNHAYVDYGIEGLRTQILYVISNLEDWNCVEGMKVKNQLKLITIKLKEMLKQVNFKEGIMKYQPLQLLYLMKMNYMKQMI